MDRFWIKVDLDEVEATAFACGPSTRQALVAATRALIALVDKERLDRWDESELNEPWATALAAVRPFRPDTFGASDGPMPEGFTSDEPF